MAEGREKVEMPISVLASVRAGGKKEKDGEREHGTSRWCGVPKNLNSLCAVAEVRMDFGHPNASG